MAVGDVAIYPHEADGMDKPFEQAEWSVRTFTCLTREGIRTLRDLCRQTQTGLRRIPNFGPKSLLEVKEYLIARHLRLGMDFGPDPAKPRVEKIGNLRAATPRCLHKVHVSSVPTVTRRIREHRAAERGHRVDQCGSYAVRRIDGEPYCLAHAGQVALRILSGEHA